MEGDVLTSMVTHKNVAPRQTCTRVYTEGYGQKSWERGGSEEVVHLPETLESGSSLF